MKSQLIVCILITFSVGLLHAESNESEASDSCYDQWMNQTRLKSACIEGVLNETELLNAVNTTIIEYSGDDEAVRVQTKKFCPILNQVLKCNLIGFDFDKECIYSEGLATKRQSYDLHRTLLNYVCANKSEVILQILQYNGFDTIYQNKKALECLNLVDGIPNINEETLRAPIEFCDGVDKVYACYVDLVRDHKNQNLVRIAGEINELHRQTLKCASAV